jgi:hypothetical protein
MPRILRAAAAALLLGLAAAGCGKPPKPVDVTGKVAFEVPRPAGPLVLSLFPLDDANKTCTPSAVLDDKDDSFRLKGCLPGRYKATLALAPLQQGGGVPAAAGGVAAAPGGRKSGLPTQYLDLQSSPWEVAVPEGGKDGLVLTVSAR